MMPLFSKLTDSELRLKTCPVTGSVCRKGKTMEIKKTRTDFWVMLILCVLSILFYFVIIPAQIPARSSWGTDSQFTSRTFPQILAIVLAISTFCGTVSSGWKLAKLKKESAPEEKKERVPIMQVLFPYFIFLLILVYGILFDKIGFAVSTALMASALLLVLRCKNWKYYVVVLVFTVAIYVIFRYGLLVMLP